jgi:hypothetical protein
VEAYSILNATSITRKSDVYGIHSCPYCRECVILTHIMNHAGFIPQALKNSLNNSSCINDTYTKGV